MDKTLSTTGDEQQGTGQEGEVAAETQQATVVDLQAFWKDGKHEVRLIDLPNNTKISVLLPDRAEPAVIHLCDYGSRIHHGCWDGIMPWRDQPRIAR